ncbi:MAG: hypothetical protein JWQ99_1257 [Blastococcus sp.]|jgi:hypothetical protein|nr:hypothetical protein [Blastococcus sp.]
MSAPPPVELLESRTEPSRLHARWTALPPRGRRLLAGLLVVVLLGAGVVWLRDWAAERALERRVVLTTSFGLASSSTSPPGGSVGYFVVVRNEGARALSVTGVQVSTARLRLRMRDDWDRRLAPGTEAAIPMSVRLSCIPGAGEPDLPAEISLRRADGGSTTRRVVLRPAAQLLDVASTLCDVRPDLRDHELSGPVLRD